MNASSFVGFNRLKESVSMVQVLDRYGLLDRLCRRGDHLTGACPIHAGHNPVQFRVNTTNNCWFCFGDCQAGGSIIDFVARKERVDVRTAGRLIQDWFIPCNASFGAGQAEARLVRRSAGKVQNLPLQFSLSGLDAGHPYLKARGLCDQTIDTFGLGYCRHGSLAGWIVIPIHNQTGELVAYAGRWPGEPPESTPRYRLPRGFRKSLELFNLNRACQANAAEPLVVVEGFFGCMRVWQAGFRRVVAAMGSILSDFQLRLIRETASKVFILFDDDDAGRAGSRKAKAQLAGLDARIISCSPFGRQPDDLSIDQLQGVLHP